MALSITPIYSILDPRLDRIFATKPVNPFVGRPFLAALEQSGSVDHEGTGWRSMHLLVSHDDGESLVLGYSKAHSYGEYVFDWPIAEAYQQAGIRYYPKWVSAVPFSPISGPRVLGVNVDTKVLSRALQQWLSSYQFSGGHLLFSDDEGLNGWVSRTNVRFEWRNQGYGSFDDFLAKLKSGKRKTIRKERRRVAEYDISIRTFVGNDISAEHWSEFYHCYCATYLKRSGHLGYLNQAFFEQLYETMREQLVLVSAFDSQQLTVAAALFLFADDTLYGRYWGALDSYDGLHFECAYYRGIDFAIDQGIENFDAGVQGEHKLIRGFEPVLNYSYHWLSDDVFMQAFNEWAGSECQRQQQYFESCIQALPYRTQND